MQLVKQHKPSFLLLDGIVDPNLALRNEFINVVMTTGRKVNVENASHEPAIHDPYTDSILQLLPQALVHCAGIRELFSSMRHLADVPGSPPFSALNPVGLGERIPI